MADTIETSVNEMEKELGITPGFLYALKDQDDWSLIIKVHSLLEGSISQLICRVLELESCFDIFAHLELSNKKSGKMAFVKSLQLLEKPDRRFIAFMSELRNKLVHNISQVAFSLDEYMCNLSPKEKENTVKKLQIFDEDELIPYKSSTYTVAGLMDKDPKYLIWYLSMYIIAIIYQTKELKYFEKKATKERQIQEYINFRSKYTKASGTSSLLEQIIASMHNNNT